MQLFALNRSSARLHMMLAIIKILTSERFNTPLVTSKRAQIPLGFMPSYISFLRIHCINFTINYSYQLLSLALVLLPHCSLQSLCKQQQE